MSILLQTTGDTVLKLNNKYLDDDILIKIPKPIFNELELNFNTLTGEATAKVSDDFIASSFPINTSKGRTVYPRSNTQNVLSFQFLLEGESITLKGYGDIDPSIIKKGVQLFGITGTYQRIEDRPDNHIFKALFNKTIENYENNTLTNITNGGAFKNCSNLKTITMKNIENVPDYSFTNDSNLTTVNIDNLKSVGNYAFTSCSSLTNINLSKVETIGTYAFSGCTSLSSVDLSSLKDLQPAAFINCTALPSLVLNNMTGSTIASSAFQNCSSLSAVSLGDAITTICASAFAGCGILTNINTENIEYIEKSAFYGCESLTTLNLPSIKDVSEGAFAYCGFSNPFTLIPNISIFKSGIFKACNNITNLDFTGKNIELQNDVFDNCIGLETVNLNGVKKFSGCFGECYNLTSVEIPTSLTTIPSWAFYKCSALETFDLKNVTSVLDNAFRFCINLKNINNLSNLKTIGSYAFQACSIESLVLNSCTTIWSEAFWECDQLSNIDIRANIVGEWSFDECININTAIIRDVKKISTYAFLDCENLENVILDVTSVPTIAPASSIFRNTPILDSSYLGHFGSIYVPASLVDAFKGATNWAIVADRITAKTITFFIDGTEYTAEEGMTWGEWVDSEYNTDGFVESDGGIWKILNQLILSGVTSSSVILDGEQYSLYSIGGGN